MIQPKSSLTYLDGRLINSRRCENAYLWLVCVPFFSLQKNFTIQKGRKLAHTAYLLKFLVKAWSHGPVLYLPESTGL